MNIIKSRLSIALILSLLAGITALSSYAQDNGFNPTQSNPGVLSRPQTAAADNYVDLGDSEDERFHNLQGWSKINAGPSPQVNTGDLTSRYQSLRKENSLDLFVQRAGVGYGLFFKTEDGGCDDSFEVYINDGANPVYTYKHGRAGNYYPLHYANVDSTLVTGQTVKVSFKSTSDDPCGRAAVYFVALKDSAEQITDLIALVQRYNLQQDVSESLIVRLQNALDAANVNDTGGVCKQMTPFMRNVEVRMNKELTMEQGMQLIAATMRIKAASGCE